MFVEVEEESKPKFVRDEVQVVIKLHSDVGLFIMNCTIVVLLNRISARYRQFLQ